LGSSFGAGSDGSLNGEENMFLVDEVEIFKVMRDKKWNKWYFTT